MNGETKVAEPVEGEGLAIVFPPHLTKNFEKADAELREAFGKGPGVPALIRLASACWTSARIRREFERAVLDTEEFDASMTCDECGYTGVVDHDHVYGHVRVCPSCEAISDDAMAPELELVAVELEAVNPLSELRGHR